LSRAGDVQLWLNEKNQQLGKEDYGRDAKAADRLLTKHKVQLLPENLTYNINLDLPGRQPHRSASTSRLALPPVKLTAVANQWGFPGCGPMDLEPFDRR